jgi:hypothetical protein
MIKPNTLSFPLATANVAGTHTHKRTLIFVLAHVLTVTQNQPLQAFTYALSLRISQP